LVSAAREEATGGAGATKARYTADQEAKKKLLAEIAKLGSPRPLGAIDADISAKKLDRYYGYSDSCQNATYDKSRVLCAEIAALEGERATASEREKLKGKLEAIETRLQGVNMETVVKSADPLADIFANVLGISASEFRFLFASALVLLTEGSCGLFLPSVLRKPAQPPATPKTPEEIVQQWASEMLATQTGKRLLFTEARQAFLRYAEEKGEKAPGYDDFRKIMKGLGYATKNNGNVYYPDVSLCNA
jgi:hypothetical protein